MLVERLVAALAAAAAEGDEGHGEEEEEEPAVEGMDDRALLEEAVRLARESKRQRTGVEHDIICVAPSTCGHCREDVKGTQYYCRSCQVRICRLPGCINAHMNGENGKTSTKYKEVEKMVIKNPNKSRAQDGPPVRHTTTVNG